MVSLHIFMLANDHKIMYNELNYLPENLTDKCKGKSLSEFALLCMIPNGTMESGSIKKREALKGFWLMERNLNENIQCYIEKGMMSP